MICAYLTKFWSKTLGQPISGCDYIQIAGDNPFNAVLSCKVCGNVSGAGFEGVMDELKTGVMQ